jgi:hypothetical protein
MTVSRTTVDAVMQRAHRSESLPDDQPERRSENNGIDPSRALVEPLSH